MLGNIVFIFDAVLMYVYISYIHNLRISHLKYIKVCVYNVHTWNPSLTQMSNYPTLITILFNFIFDSKSVWQTVHILFPCFTPEPLDFVLLYIFFVFWDTQIAASLYMLNCLETEIIYSAVPLERGQFSDKCL